jgi:hypothetical protein
MDLSLIDYCILNSSDLETGPSFLSRKVIPGYTNIAKAAA